MKTLVNRYIAWTLLLISSFSAFSVGAFSGASVAGSDDLSVVSANQFSRLHLPNFHSAPSEFRFNNSLLEAFEVEEETESDADDREAAAKGESDGDQDSLHDAELTSPQSFAATAAAVPQKEILPEGFSSAFPTTRSLYLIFRVFRI